MTERVAVQRVFVVKTCGGLRVRTKMRLWAVGTLSTLATIASLILNTPEAKSQNAPNSPITIQGTVWSAPTNIYPQTNISIYDPDANVFLGNTTTNTQGNYSITVLPVGLEDKINPNTDMTVLGNPIMNEANLELTILNQDNYTIRVFENTGKQIFNQKVFLAEGDNKIKISGLGAPGLKIVEVTDGQKKYTAKVLQIESTDFSPRISATPTSGKTCTLKSTDYTTQLEIHFEPVDPGYLPNTKTVTAQNATVNDTVLAQSTTLNKVLHVYDLHGESIKPNGSSIASYFTLKIEFKDGTIIPIAASNGDITINRVEYYPNITDTLKFLPDTLSNPHFTNEMILRHIHQQRYTPNIAQTEDPSAYNKLNVPVANMPDETQLYLVPSKVLDPRNMTDSIHTKSLTFRNLLNYIPGYLTKFVDVTTSRPLYIVIDTWDLYNNQPVSQFNLDRMETEIRKQSDVLPFLANSDSLLPGFVITRENSYNSTIWQEITNRGQNQFLEAQYESGTQPGAAVELTYNGSYNGSGIIKNATITVNPSDGNAAIGEEFGHGMWDKPDPTGGGSLGAFIYNNNGTQSISDFWKVNVRLGLLYDPGVPPLAIRD